MKILELVQASPFLLVALSTVLGLLVGSFLNVVIYRLPIMLQRDWRAQCHEFLEIENKTPDTNE